MIPRLELLSEMSLRPSETPLTPSEMPEQAPEILLVPSDKNRTSFVTIIKPINAEGLS